MKNDNIIQALVTANEVAFKTIKELQYRIESLELQLQSYEGAKKKKEPNYHYVDFDLKHSEEYIKGYKDCETRIKEKIDEAMLIWRV